MLTILTIIGLVAIGYIGYSAGQFIGKVILVVKALLDTSIRLSFVVLIISLIVFYMG